MFFENKGAFFSLVVSDLRWASLFQDQSKLDRFDPFAGKLERSAPFAGKLERSAPFAGKLERFASFLGKLEHFASSAEPLLCSSVWPR
jgi:hypothetical protein